MIEKFFTLKIIEEFIIPIIIIIIAILWCFISTIKWNRKEKWLKTHGYKRYLLSPRNGYHEAIYEWRNNDNLKEIREDTVEKMKYKKFIKKMQEGIK